MKQRAKELKELTELTEQQSAADWGRLTWGACPATRRLS